MRVWTACVTGLAFTSIVANVTVAQDFDQKKAIVDMPSADSCLSSLIRARQFVAIGSLHRATTYANDKGHEVVYCMLHGVGHSIPRSLRPVMDGLVVDFLMRHKKP